MRKKIPLILSFLVLFTFISFASPMTTKVAEASKIGDAFNDAIDDYIDKNVEDQIKQAGANPDKNRSKYADDNGNVYYKLEARLSEDDKSSWYNLPGKVGDSINIALNEAVMVVNHVVFKSNVTLSMLPIGALEMSSDFAFVDKAIDKISKKVKSLVGMSGSDEAPSFSSGGLFGSLVKLIALLVIIYAFYQLVWKRSFISSFGEIAKFVVVLTVALLLFGNFGTFLTGMNKISNEVGNFIVNSESSEGEMDTSIETFSNTLWSHFVDDPYLSLQYGTTDVGSLGVEGISGEERVKALLRLPPGIDARGSVVDTEVNEIENYYMSYDSVNSKTHLNLIYFMLNAITSIPLLIIALAIIFTQFWFVTIALFAPFALLIASFPSQFGVLKRYLFELSLPLMIKVALHFVLVVVIFLSELFTGIQEDVNAEIFSGQIGNAFVTSILFVMLFFSIFVLRKRITGILTSGSDMVGNIREGLGSVSTKPFVNGIQGVATASGAVVGGATGGPAGAAMGANMGATASKIATGQSDGLTGATQDVVRTASQAQRLKHFKGKGEDGKFDDSQYSEQNSALEQEQNENEEKEEKEERDRINTQLQQEQMEQNHQVANEFLDSKEIDEDGKQKYIDAMHDENVDFTKLNENTLDRNFDQNGENNPQEVAQNIKKQQDDESTRYNQLSSKRKGEFNDYLKGQNLNESEVDKINSHLESKGIDTAHIPKGDLKEVNNDIRQRMESGETLDYADEMKNGLEDRAKIRQDHQHEKLSGHQELTKGVPTSNLNADPINESVIDKSDTPKKDIDFTAPLETNDIQSNNEKGSETKINSVNTNELQDKSLKTGNVESSTTENSSLESSKVEGSEVKSTAPEGSRVKENVSKENKLKDNSKKENKQSKKPKQHQQNKQHQDQQQTNTSHNVHNVDVEKHSNNERTNHTSMDNNNGGHDLD